MHLLIDANNLVHRAWHALKHEDTGTHSHAVIGFVNMLLSAISDYKPGYVHICFDSWPIGTNLRLKIYDQYKANRDRDSETYIQVQKTRQLCQLANLNVYYAEGYEADDLIYTLTRKLAGQQLVVVTNDGDLMQLASNSVGVTKITNAFAARRLFYQGDVLGHYGLRPDQLLDYKALRGDVSDNVPGVEGIGEVWAKKLIGKYGTIHRLYGELPLMTKKDLSQSKLAALRAGEEAAFMSYKLCSLMEAPIEPGDIPLNPLGLHAAMHELGIAVERYEHDQRA